LIVGRIYKEQCSCQQRWKSYADRSIFLL